MAVLRATTVPSSTSGQDTNTQMRKTMTSVPAGIAASDDREIARMFCSARGEQGSKRGIERGIERGRERAAPAGERARERWKGRAC